MELEKFQRERLHFPAQEGSIYFNAASFGLVPDYVLKATEENNRQRCYHQNIGVNGKSQYAMLEEVRPVFARLINARA